MMISIVRGAGQVTVFPNPADDALTLLFAKHHGVARAVLVDGLGRTVQITAIPDQDGGTRVVPLALTGVRSGHYTLVLFDAAGTALERVPVVKR